MALMPDTRPFPPGDYGAVVVGSGPGGLQVSYFLRRLGVEHAVVSADAGPAGMFRRFPLFERLISWTHRSADVPHETREFEAHDQNSLIADEPELRSLVAREMADGRRRPTRDEMEAGLHAFADKAPVPVRYGCRWEATRQEGERYVVVTGDGEYGCRAVVFATGMTDAWVPAVPGLELAQHYVHAADDPARYRDRRVVIIGKRNSAFEIGEEILRHGLRELTLVSPRPADTARLARSPLRPWYLTPYDEHVRGAPGRYVLDASIERVERDADGYRVHALEPTRPEPLVLEADIVIAATGFSAPLGDLPQLGLATVADGRLPAVTPFWESVTLPRIFFAGNISQASRGLRKHGVASLSSMVCGFRYNARILAQHIAETVFGRRLERPHVEPDRIAAYLLREVNRAPELAMQKGYLARVLSIDASSAVRDEGILPLEVFVDGTGDAVAATVEFDEHEAITPMLYVRRDGSVREHALPPHPLRRYVGDAYLAPLEAALRPLTGA